MKINSVLLYSFGIFGLMNISCNRDIPLPTRVLACDFSLREDIAVTDVRLKAPTGMGTYFYGGIPGNKEIPTLPQALQQVDLNAPNTAKITTPLKASGKTCTGEKTFEFKAGDSRIGGNFLKLDTPKGVNFIRTATMIIRSDNYRVSSTVNEYVLWSGSGNDPQFKGINSNILGSRQTINSSSGKVAIDKDGCYIKNGIKICQ